MMAVDALKAFKASSRASAEEHFLDSVPDELLAAAGPNLNMKRWSMLLEDEDLKKVNMLGANREFYRLDPSQITLRDMFVNFWTKSPSWESLLVVNISGASKVTDYGLALIARNNAQLKEVDISHCPNISDIGLREVGLFCEHLASLNVSSTLITGVSLIAIAENCTDLKVLNVSRCAQLEKPGLTKIFYKCNKLESVNISHLKDIGDNELRVLAQSSTHLRVLLARDTPLVSDQSLMLLAHRCVELETVDVSRAQLTFKITDISLLALGESCPSLRLLRLGGCDAITDVGINWLTAGSKYLEEIDISGCVKVILISLCESYPFHFC